MTREDIIRMAREAGIDAEKDTLCRYDGWVKPLERFAKLVAKECIDKIETHRISVGNSAAGEMACAWTYAALKEISDEIKEHFGVKE